MFTELLDKMSRSGRRAYEVFTAQAVCSTIAELQLQKIKEENHAGGSYTENDCPCFQVLKADCRCTEKSHEDVSGAPESRTTGNAWKMSVKKLVGQGMGASSIEVTDNNIKSFERVARKYNVDFAVKKDKTVEPPKYMVFFKGKDADVITQAFKEFVKVNEKKRGRVSVKEKLAEFRELLGKDKNRERAREHQKDRGQSL